jgi:hypothetical protein
VTRVPNVFHFVFGLRPQTEPFHLMHYLCLASCIAVNRPDAVQFHYQNEPWGEYWDLIRPSLTLVPVQPDSFVSSYRYADPKFDSLRYAHLADVARLEILAEQGGIYADMDTLFVAPLPASFFEHSFVMGEEQFDAGQPGAKEIGGSLCNAWMMGEPDAPFVREWLAKFQAGFTGSWNAHSTLLPYRLSREHPDLVHVEPKRSFFHFDWSAEGLRDIFKRRVTDLAGIYSMHLWSHTWWDPKHRNAALFHAGRLTPAYVRHAHTTYADIARNFLPAELAGQDRQTWMREEWRAAQENALWIALNLKGKVERRVFGRA